MGKKQTDYTKEPVKEELRTTIKSAESANFFEVVKESLSNFGNTLLSKRKRDSEKMQEIEKRIETEEEVNLLKQEQNEANENQDYRPTKQKKLSQTKIIDNPVTLKQDQPSGQKQESNSEERSSSPTHNSKESEMTIEIIREKLEENEREIEKYEAIKQTQQREKEKLLTSDYTINAELSDSDFQIFANYLRKDPADAQNFVDNYLVNHLDLTRDDLATLILIKVIQTEDLSLSRSIFSFLCENGVSDLHYLTAQDKDGKTVITYALETQSCIRRIADKIFEITHQSDNEIVDKFELTEGLLNNMVKAFTKDRFRTHPEILVDDLIRPLYTKESVDNLIQALGDDWFNHYYVREIE